MVNISYKQEILEQLDSLSTEQQRQVLEFVREVQRPSGEPGPSLVQHAREIRFPHEDLEEMKRVIEEEFERVDDE
jgi:mRNA-degrading endonuclease RelE of RelBE toxin-antitoxin system